jgi:hypothetical protein
MSRRVKDFVEIADQVSLEDLIRKLSEVRDGLPNKADARLKLRGDDVFGHRITISFFRPQTEEEAELERRYAEPGKRRKLRIAA